MAAYLAVDTERVGILLNKLPPLPLLLIHLAFGASKLKDSASITRFSRTGLITPETDELIKAS